MDALPEASGAFDFCKNKNKLKSTCTIRTKCTNPVRMVHLVHVLFTSQLILERNETNERNNNGHYKAEENLPMIEIPVWEKSNLTLEEAAAYSGIGINKLRKLSDTETCPFVLWIGSKRLIKRRKLDEYTDRMYSL